MNKNTILKEYFGYNRLKDEQEMIVDSILQGNDTIGLLPTGYGKSITFQIPSLIFDGITIVITPLISLMQDQVRILKKHFIKAEYINSLQDQFEQNSIYNKILKGNVKLLYVSAERLKTNKFKEIIKKVNVDLVVCDEAHTLLWSEDFRYALGEVNDFINILDRRPPILALTATATNKTIDKIEAILNLNNPLIVIGDCDRKNIYYDVVKTNNKDKSLIQLLKNNEKIIIYCLTVKSCIHVNQILKDNNIKSVIYHGQLAAEEKIIVQNKFTKDECNIIICTNAFGMGIDIPNIRLVIEYDLPQSIEDFSQQTGRASRDGKYARAVVLFNLNDIKTIEYFINNIENKKLSSSELRKVKIDRINKMDEMIKLCIGKKCIHQKIANYFGVKHLGNCNMCCNCK